jgi:Asp-tRNA(Asn)/Glu-tRNA(Gln) amidotransferase A subunit family amidase
MVEILDIDVPEVAALLQSGEVSAESYVQSCLERHAECADINAVTWIKADRVLVEARSIDARRRNGEALPALAGIPFAVKDNIAAQGFPTTAGSRTLEGAPAKADAMVVRQLRELGAIMFGKTNMHELAMGGTTTNAFYGATRNPRARDHVPGGSSGGSAAAVAAGMVPFALGTDTAASVRFPAAFCGVAGFRPTTQSRHAKLYSSHGVVPVSLDLDTIGPIAKSVRGIAFIDAALRRRKLALPVSDRRLRIGVPNSYFLDILDPSIRLVTERALAKLEDGGSDLVTVDVSGYAQQAADGFNVMMLTAMVHDVPEFLASDRGIDFNALVAGIKGEDVRFLFDLAARLGGDEAALFRLQTELRQSLQQGYEQVLLTAGVDVLAYPTSPILPPKIQEEGDKDDAQVLLDGESHPVGAMMIRNTQVGSFIGSPGVSVPIGTSAEGLPVGLELQGLLWQDDKLLSDAMLVERVLNS